MGLEVIEKVVYVFEFFSFGNKDSSSAGRSFGSTRFFFLVIFLMITMMSARALIPNAISGCDFIP